MNNALDKRLAALETQIKSAAESPLWIDGQNNVIRVDVNAHRGQPVTFPTACEAAKWLEAQIDAHPTAAGSYSCDRLADLYRNPAALLDTLAAAMGGRVVDVHGLEYSVDSWPGFVIGNLKPGAADLKLWLLAGGALVFFETKEFKARWQAQQFTDDDAAMYAACYVLFAWERPGATTDDFSELILQIMKG